jgi:hypothetical protein
MTVRDLINALGRFPAEWPVSVAAIGDGYALVEDIDHVVPNGLSVQVGIMVREHLTTMPPRSVEKEDLDALPIDVALGPSPNPCGSYETPPCSCTYVSPLDEEGPA